MSPNISSQSSNVSNYTFDYRGNLFLVVVFFAIAFVGIVS